MHIHIDVPHENKFLEIKYMSTWFNKMINLCKSQHACMHDVHQKSYLKFS